MLFTWDWKNTCIVFKWWHVRTFTDFVLTFITIAVLALGYELAKLWFSRWQKKTLAVPSASNSASLKQVRLKQSLFYGFQVGYSFMLMLVFMSYNGWFMIAVVLGAVVGNQLWNRDVFDNESNRSLACH